MDLLGRYRLGDEIGSGGMATVYAGEVIGAEGFRKPVVVKRVHPHLTRHPAFVELLVREAKLTVRLDHPNIVDVLELGQVGDDLFLVMERVDGCDLAQFISAAARDGVRVAPELATHLAREVLAGLGYAHEARDDLGQPLHVVHRDVSPSNVLLGWDGRVKLTDFGVAHSELDETRGGLKGKPAYMSPEQALGSKLDARSDLYTAGLMLYELLAGRRALQGSGEMEMLNVARAGALARAPLDAVPARYRDALRRALDPDPRQRFETASRMREALAPLSLDLESGRERLAELLSLLQPQSAASLASSALQTATGPDEPGRSLVTRARATEGEVPVTRPAIPAKRRASPVPWLLAALLVLVVGVAAGLSVRGKWLSSPGEAGSVSGVGGEPSAPQPDMPEPEIEVALEASSGIAVDVVPPSDPAGSTVTRATEETDSADSLVADEAPGDLSPTGGAGTLSVVVPGATGEVWVDVPGWEPRPAPFQGAVLPAGTWTVKVTNPDLGLRWEGQVTVVEGEEVGLQFRKSEDGWKRWERRPE